jgi:hypothetical protein
MFSAAPRRKKAVSRARRAADSWWGSALRCAPGTARVSCLAGARDRELFQASDDAGRSGRHSTAWEHEMLKVALWIVVVIFIIGLLVVFGVLDLIF